MEKFLVVDIDGVSDEENSVIEDVKTMDAALESADEFADELIANGDPNDAETVYVGIYKLVKTVKVTLQRTRVVTSVK